jgi:hypothetical protein
MANKTMGGPKTTPDDSVVCEGITSKDGADGLVFLAIGIVSVPCDGCNQILVMNCCLCI